MLDRVSGALARRWLQVLVVATLTFIGRAPDVFYDARDWDEAAMMSQAWAVSRGDTLYVDVFQIHPPLNILIFVPFFEGFAPPVVPHAIKVFNALLLLGCALLVGEIALRWLRQPLAALLAAILFAHKMSDRFPFTQASYGELYAILPILLVVLLLFFAERPAPRREWLAGVFCGLAILIKQVEVIDVIVLVAGYLLISPDSARRKAAAVANLAGGLLIPLVAIGAYLASTGALLEAYRSTVGIMAKGYLQGGQRWTAEPLADFVSRFRWEAGAILTGGGLLILRRLTNRGEDGDAVDRPIILPWALWIFWVAAVLAMLTRAGRFYEHYLIELIVPMVLAASLFAALLGRRVQVTVVALIGSAIFTMVGWSSWDHLRTIAKAQWRPPEVMRSTHVAEFIRRHTGPRDTMFIYRVPDLDVFYLAERRSPNGIYMFVDMLAGHMHDPALARRKEQELLQNLPAAFLVYDGWPTDEYHPVQPSDQFFVSLLARDYRLAAVIDGLQIHLRKDLRRPDPPDRRDHLGGADHAQTKPRRHENRSVQKLILTLRISRWSAAFAAPPFHSPGSTGWAGRCRTPGIPTACRR